MKHPSVGDYGAYKDRCGNITLIVWGRDNKVLHIDSYLRNHASVVRVFKDLESGIDPTVAWEDDDEREIWRERWGPNVEHSCFNFIMRRDVEVLSPTTNNEE